jgi:tyrosyl-tRNA synthetase
MSDLFADLEWRGLVHQVTDPELPKLLDHDSLTAYVGFDPSADSLHLGNLIQLCNLRRLQEAGHSPIALAGGGTGLIGDPGGKTEERALLSMDELAANLAGIRSQLERILDFSPEAGARRARLLDNGEWLWSVGLLEFLRDVGKHFTVNQMVAKDSVRARFEGREHGISFTEFSYMLLQAYDFLHLFDRHGCRLQMGASDQWGNITIGVELVRKARRAEVYGLTTPLLLKPDGTKFGKTESGTIWLDARRTSPYALYQQMVRTDDDNVGLYLRYFTWLERGRIEELERATEARPEARQAQRVLAWEVTALVHGRAEADAAARAADVLFSEDVAGLDEATLLEVFADAPSSARSRAEFEGDGLALVDALVDAGLVGSRSGARTTIRQGGAYVNNRREQDEERLITTADLLCGRYVLLRRGKRDHHLVRVG